MYRKLWVWLIRLAALAALLLFILPHAIRWGAQDWLTDHGAVESRIDNVDFNPFTGRLAFYGIAVQGAEADSLDCESFKVDLSWLPMFEKRLEVARLEVKGLDFDARRLDDGQWRLGGVGLPIEKDDREKEEEKQKEKDKSEWQWGIRETQLQDVAMDLRAGKIDERFAIRSFRAGKLYRWKGEAPTSFHLKMDAFGGDLVFEGQGRPFSTPVSFDADVQSRNVELKTLEPFLETPISGVLRLDLEVESNSEKESEAFQIEIDGEAAIADLRFDMGDLHLAGSNVGWSGSFRFTGGETKWMMEGDLDAEELELDDSGKGLNMMRAAALSVEGAHLEPNDVTLDRAVISGIEAFERYKGAVEEFAGEGETVPLDQSAHLVRAREVELGPMRFHEEMLSFEKVLFEDPEILLVHLPEGGMEVSAWGDDEEKKETDKTSGDTEEGEEEKNGDGLQVKIVDFKLNKGRLLFVDRAISPAVRFDARPVQLDVENIDTAAPEEDVSLVLDSKIDDYATLHVEGTVQPFSEALNLNLTGRISSFSLPSLSPYSARHLDYRLNQGHLDASLKWRIENWQLEAENDLKMSKLKVESLKKDENTRLTDLLGLQASTALSLLRDRQDNIEIELPLQGDMRDPQFEFDRVIVQAMRQTVQKTAVFYYAPLGLSLLTGVPLPPGSLTIADRVIDWATSVRFDPVQFSPGSSELEEDARAYIEKIVSRLKEKENLRIVICGRAGQADLGDEKRPEKPWNEETRQTLLDLARKRSLVVKEALVEAGIDGDRLFLCQPQLGEVKEPGPRVDIYL